MSRREKIDKCVSDARLWKTISWRVISWIASFGIALFLTGNIAMALSFGFADTIIKTLIYWWHEYRWDKVLSKKIQRIELKQFKY